MKLQSPDVTRNQDLEVAVIAPHSSLLMGRRDFRRRVAACRRMLLKWNSLPWIHELQEAIEAPLVLWEDSKYDTTFRGKLQLGAKGLEVLGLFSSESGPCPGRTNVYRCEVRITTGPVEADAIAIHKYEPAYSLRHRHALTRLVLLDFDPRIARDTLLRTARSFGITPSPEPHIASAFEGAGERAAIEPVTGKKLSLEPSVLFPFQEERGIEIIEEALTGANPRHRLFKLGLRGAGNTLPATVKDLAKYRAYFLKDKNSIRALASQIGWLEQPRWIGHYSENGATYRTFTRPQFFSAISPEELGAVFPFEEIIRQIDTDTRAKQSTTFDFGLFTLSTGPRRLQCGDDTLHLHHMKSAREDVERFLRRTLKRSDAKLLRCEDSHYSSDSKSFLSRMLELGDTIYLKPSAGTACGKGIFKIARVEDGYSVDTDCFRTFDILKLVKTRNVSHDRQDWIGHVIDFAETASMLAGASRGYTMRSVEDLSRLLFPLLEYGVSELTSTYDVPIGWIAEEAIPMERARGRRAEMRLAFKPTRPDGPYALVGHYSKLSKRNVAGNIALGAKGESSYETLYSILSARMPRATPKARHELAELGLRDVVERSEMFLAEFLSMLLEASNDAYGISREDRSDNSFSRATGIDVAPVWDDEAERFRWYLIELQGNAIGIKGLRRANRARYDLAEGLKFSRQDIL